MDTEDRDNAARFKVMWEGRLLWEPHSGRHGRWLEYQDGIWVEGGGEAGLVKCDEIVRHYDLEIQQLSQQPGTSTDTLKLYKKARQALRNVPARSRALSLAKELMSADRIEFDANPLLVCCEDTVLDLSDAQQVHARPPTPEDYLRSRVRASWSGPTQGPDLPASFWEERVAEWLPEPEVREAFQMFIGLCLTGSLAYQVFGFLYGSGGTGKSTAANAILEVLGGYGMTSKFKHFTEQRGRDSAGVSPHLVRMKGRRLVAAFEVSRGASFDTALIKSLTGGEKVVGRGLYQDETEFKATAKLLFVGNDRPKVDREDSALWRRLVVFGFHTPQGSRRNVHLPQQLASSEVRNQILRWAVEGWQRLQQKPEFPIPGPCSAEVKRWQEESDLLREFVEECCELDPEAWVSSQDLWEAYLGWVGDTKSALNRKGFSQALLRPGVESKRSGDKANTRGFQGIRLRSPLAGENTS
jgi:putative DNA primase/helicase